MYALVNTITMAIDRFLPDVSADVTTKPPFKWLPVIRSAKPTPTESQIVSGPYYDVTPESVSERYEIREKSPGEVADDIDAKVARINVETRAALAALETRLAALEGKPSKGIMAFLRSLFS